VSATQQACVILPDDGGGSPLVGSACAHAGGGLNGYQEFMQAQTDLEILNSHQRHLATIVRELEADTRDTVRSRLKQAIRHSRNRSDAPASAGMRGSAPPDQPHLNGYTFSTLN
jgi:hypothetical protein